MTDTFPTKRSEALTPKVRKIKNPRARKDRPASKWTRDRIDYAQLEAAKLLVANIVYKEIPPSEKSKGFKKELRVSVLPWSDAAYVDIRMYMQGRSTGQGVLVHIDKFPDLLSAVIQADRDVQKLRDSGIISR